MSDTSKEECTDCGAPVDWELELAAAKAEVEALRADAADFHMAYRIRGGHLAVASEMIDSLRAEVEALRAALTDMYAGWKYIRSFHGDLYGVGWDRCDEKARAALTKEKAF
jgi:hypothetical protein